MSAGPYDGDRSARPAPAAEGRPAGPPDAVRPGEEAGDTPVGAAQRCAAVHRWLLDELRDECSDIGVSARGFDLDAFAEGIGVFAREARRLGLLPERMLVLLKDCLTDEALSRADREHYQLYVDRAVTMAVRAYFATPAMSGDRLGADAAPAGPGG